MSPQRASAGARAGVSAVALTILAVGVMLLLVMFAARVGPQRIIHGPLVDPSFHPGTPLFHRSFPPGNHQTREELAQAHTGRFFLVLAVLIRLALAALLLWGLYRVLAWARDALGRRRKSRRAEQVEFEVLDDPEPMAEAIRADAVDQLELLLGGSPRNSIVACWDRFEEQAERAHVARRDWETSSEFTLRLLDRVSADPAAVSTLEGLYREARFSDHEINESHQQQAIAALRAIHLSVGVGTVTG